MDARPTTDGVHVAIDSGSAVIAFVGDVDLSREAAADRALEQVLAAHPSQVRIDFSDAEFVGVAGVRFALAAQQRVRTYGGSVNIVAPGRTRRIFDLTHAALDFSD